MAALDTPLERGQALAIEGDFPAALEALEEATSKNASDAKAWEATAQVLLAASDDSDERSAAKALVAAQKAVDNAPLWAPAAVTRGTMVAKRTSDGASIRSRPRCRSPAAVLASSPQNSRCEATTEWPAS